MLLERYDPERPPAKEGDPGMRTLELACAENLTRIKSTLVAGTLVDASFVFSDVVKAYSCRHCKRMGDQSGKWNKCNSDGVAKHMMRPSHLEFLFDNVSPANPHADAGAHARDVTESLMPPRPPRRAGGSERPRHVDTEQIAVDKAIIKESLGVLGIPLHRAYESDLLKAACSRVAGGGTRVSPLSSLYAMVPEVLQEEIERIRSELEGARVSIACDSAGFFGTGRLGIIACYVDPATGSLTTRSLAVVSGGGKAAAALAVIIENTLKEFGLAPDRIVSISGDAENTNLALFRQLETFGIFVRLPCFSHLLSTAGKLVVCPPLDRLRLAFTAATSNSYNACELLQNAYIAAHPGVTVPVIVAFSETRFYSLYEYVAETLIPFLDTLGILARGRQLREATSRTKAQTSFSDHATPHKRVVYSDGFTALLDVYLAEADVLHRVLPMYTQLLGPLVHACYALESAHIGAHTAEVLASLMTYIDTADAEKLARAPYAPCADLDASAAFEYLREHLGLDANRVDVLFPADSERPKSYKTSRLFYESVRFLDPLFLESQLAIEVRRGTALAAAREHVAREHLLAFRGHPWSTRVARELHDDPDFERACDEITVLLSALRQPDVRGPLEATTDAYARSIELRSPYAARSSALFDWWCHEDRRAKFPSLHRLYQTVVAMMPSNCAMERKISSWRDLVTPQQSSSSHNYFETMCILYTNTKVRKADLLSLRKGTILETKGRKRKRNPASAAAATRALRAEIAENTDRVRSLASAAPIAAAARPRSLFDLIADGSRDDHSNDDESAGASSSEHAHHNRKASARALRR